VFVWIAVGLLSVLALFAAAVAALAIFSIETINNAGGWGWLLIGGASIAVGTVVCLASAVCSAISILRREPHARLATFILVICSLEVWVFRGSLFALARVFEPDPTVAIVRAEAELSTALTGHFANSNLVLKPGGRNGGFQTSWHLQDADVDTRCDVSVRFRHFPRGTPVDMMRKAIQGTIPPPVLNEQASLAMFLPNAMASSPIASVCDGWSAKSAEVSGRIVSAFKTFRPPPVGSR
jgi:hypothetical protein